MTWAQRQAENRVRQLAYQTERMDEFVPPAGSDTWATYVPTRDYPEWKLHKGKGQARGALAVPLWLGGVRGGLIFNLVDGEWKLIERVEPGTPADEVPWRRKSG